MRRIYACIAIVAVLLMAAFYSSWKVQHFAEEIFSDIDTAMEAIRDEDFTTARKALAHGADLCDQMRMHMNHLLRTEDFTELEASLRAADGHLEMNAAEEAFGELRRAQVRGNDGMAGPADPLNRQIKKPYRLRNKLSGNRHGFYCICVLFFAVAHQLFVH